MGKQRIDIEYPLTTKSPNIIWEQISSPHGLERWLADHVTEDNGVFTFTWGEPWTEQDIRKAKGIAKSEERDAALNHFIDIFLLVFIIRYIRVIRGLLIVILLQCGISIELALRQRNVLLAGSP